MEQESRSSDKRRIPPYGPVKGMVEGLQLLQRLTPAVVDESLLRANKVAPNNEYKVLGALRFLDLVDEEGRPTEKSRLLKTRGATYMLNLQEIVRAAYADLFNRVSLKEASRDRIYNYFVTEAKMGSEMATKATRFFIELCRLADFDMGAELGEGRQGRSEAPRRAAPRPKRTPSIKETPPEELRVPASFAPSGPPVILAITPETARMGEEDLERLFRRMLRAWRRAVEDRAE